MLVYDINDIYIEDPNLELGHLIPDKLLVERHLGVEAIEEEGHYEVSKVYPNGGKDYDWVIDVPAQEAQEPWDEYIDILRYIEYTQEELDAMNEPTLEDKIAELEQKITRMETALIATIPELGL